MRQFGFHSLDIYTPVTPHADISFILTMFVYNDSVVIGCFQKFHLLTKLYVSDELKMQIISYETVGKRKMLLFEKNDSKQ